MNTSQNASMMHILTRLNLISATTKLKEKEVMLKEALEDADFRSVIHMMLSPYRTFGIMNYSNTLGLSVNPEIKFYELEELMGSLESRRLSGNAARDACAKAIARGVPNELMTRILEGDPKAGFGATMVNKVLPGFLPEFPYMRCALPEKSNIDKWNWAAGVFSQLKADGMFMNVNVDIAGQVQLLSRQGQIFPEKGFEDFHEAVRKTFDHNTQTHGEMIVYKDGKLLDRQTGNGIINSVAQGGNWDGALIQFMAWDQIPLSEVKTKAKYTKKYIERLNNLISQVQKGPSYMLTVIPHSIVYSKREAYEHFATMVGQGLEGTVVKTPDLDWKDGTSKDQVKLKLSFIVDVKITGFTEGKGKFATTFGAIMYESTDGLLKGQVSGMDDKTRQSVSDNRESYLGTIMAVEANAIFKPSASNSYHSLSHPRVVEFRAQADKDTADTLQQCFDQMQSAINNAAAI